MDCDILSKNRYNSPRKKIRTIKGEWNHEIWYYFNYSRLHWVEKHEKKYYQQVNGYIFVFNAQSAYHSLNIKNWM